MERLLCILSSMNAGGAETFLMKVYRQLDKAKYQFDFCINERNKCFYEDEILSMGGKIYRITEKSASLLKFKKQLYEVVNSNGYQYVLRVCSNAAGFMDLEIAHKAGAKVCAVRSSNSSDGRGLKLKIAHTLGQLMYSRYVNVKIAPSDLAAIYTFGEKAYKDGAVNMLHNAVDLNTYRYDAKIREHLRSEIGVSRETVLLGHVGRFMTQKNHKFLLQVFEEFLKIKEDSRLMLIGGGPLEEEIRSRVKELGLDGKVIFMGIRSDVPGLLSAMDALVFPSLYEGMPNTVIEAQATGLPCVIADTITREANITGLVQYLPLGNAKQWADYLAKLPPVTRATPVQSFIDNCYDIESVTSRFVKLVFQR